MKYFITYRSTAPIILLITVTFLAGILIEINLYFPNMLSFAPRFQIL